MTTAAWFHCFSGISGDMALGALLDAGADVGRARELLGRLPIDGWALDIETTQRNGIGATRALVRTTVDGPQRRLADIEKLVVAADLPERVEQRSLLIFRRLAEVEAAVHRTTVEDVHFHEVGAVDAIVDVVGTCIALELLGIDEVHAGPVAVGHGTLSAAHGTLPNPGPAVVALLEGRPVFGVDLTVELTTPTGAAILAALATSWGPLPTMRVAAVGYGAGQRELRDRPNVTQVVVGDLQVADRSPGQPVTLLEANLDDVTGEVLAHAVAALLDAGAHDAWVTPIVMKKGRPAHTIHALCDPALRDQVAATLVAETGTLGLRGHTLERWPQPRQEAIVTVEGQPARVKVGSGRTKPEYDDAAAIAERTGIALHEVLRRAEDDAT